MSWTPRCDGPNIEHAKRLRDKIEAYELLEKFHRMSARDQRVFVAMFNALADGKVAKEK